MAGLVIAGAGVLLAAAIVIHDMIAR